MIRALLMILPFAIGMTAKAATCDWGVEVYKAKVSDACQKEFYGMLKDEQDKISARRIFANWQPLPKTTDVYATDYGFFQMNDDDRDYLFQVQYLSEKPTIAWVNGDIVIDDSSDTSKFRRAERLLKKADEATVAKMDPVRMFLMMDTANAKSQDQSQMEADQLFVYDVAGKKGTAAEMLKGDNLDRSVIPPKQSFFYFSHDNFQCNDKKQIGPIDQDINGVKVTIRPVEGKRNEFVAALPGGKNIKVALGMEHVQPPKELVQLRKWKDHKKKHRKKYHKVVGTPCQERYSESLKDTCTSIYQDLAQDPKFPEIAQAMKKAQEAKAAKALQESGNDVQNSLPGLEDDKDVQKGAKHAHHKKHEKKAEAAAAQGDDTPTYGKDITCGSVYKDDKDKRGACLRSFAGHFPTIVKEGEAKYFECTDDKGCTKQLSDDDVAAMEKPDVKKLDPKQVTGKDLKMAMDGYKNVLKQNGFDGDKYCKIADGADGLSRAQCSMPSADDLKGKGGQVKAELQNALDVVQHPERAQVAAESASFRDALERRLIGVMMMNDACGNKRAAETLSSNWRADVKSKQSGPAAQ